MKDIPDKNILIFRSCLVSVEYPGMESATKYVFDKLGIEYIVDENQSCCTGLGHYSDIFDQVSTSIIGARNFHVANRTGHNNIAMLCSTCYAINKKVAKLLNSNDELRDEVNDVFDKTDLSEMKYTKGDTDSSENIFHVAEILYNKKDEISKHLKVDFSNCRIATHHACHYCKVQYKDTVEGVRDPNLLDELIEACGLETIGWYDHKRVTCGSGFRQRFVNRDLSLKVTAEKLMALNDEKVDILIHMCPNCQIQFDRYQPFISKENNLDLNIFHLNIAQFLSLAMGADPYKVAGIQTHTVPIEPLIEKIEENNDYEFNLEKRNWNNNLEDSGKSTDLEANLENNDSNLENSKIDDGEI